MRTYGQNDVVHSGEDEYDGFTNVSHITSVNGKFDKPMRPFFKL